MVKGILVYFVTDGPILFITAGGVGVWQVQAQVSGDSGRTVGPMVFTFELEEQALKFKRDVNYQMEPTVLGGKE